MPVLPSPLDRSPSWPRNKLNFLFRPGYTASKLKGAIQNLEGDLTTDAAAKITRDVGWYVYTGLAYAELIELATARLEAQATTSAATQERILQELASLNSQVQSLQNLVQSLVNAQGVMVPHWQTQQEVEEGDDMGMNVPSAVDLGLIVEMHFLQQEPGFKHGQVVSINPPPDTLVRIGSTVVVEVNLTG
jgi:hypothetical protein